MYCFRTLVEQLESITVNVCRAKGASEDSVSFELTSLANDKQQKALDLLKTIRYPMKRKPV